MFINPMWDNETERIGKHKCTPLGYALHVVSDLLGFIGLLLLACACFYLAYKGITSTFRASLLWLLSVPFGLGLLGRILYLISWKMAAKKGFEYNAESREAKWLENGQRVTFKWESNKLD